MATYATERRLCRARDGAYVGGVCAGLAEYFEVDTIVVRILAVMLAFLTFGVACIAYVVLWMRLPLASQSRAPYDVRPESAESTSFGCFDCDAGLQPEVRGSIPLVARLAIAVGLMGLFLIVATAAAPLVPGTQWWQFWPIGLVMAGLCLIIIPVRTRYEALWHVAGVIITSLAASMLPMSLGIMSWSTVLCAFERMWPIVAVSLALFAIGMTRRNDGLLLLAAVGVVAFCVLGTTLCVVPGEIESLLFSMPSGSSIKIMLVR